MFWDTCSGALDWQACLSEISMVCLEQLCPTSSLLGDMFRSFGLTHLFLTVFDGMFGAVMAHCQCSRTHVQAFGLSSLFVTDVDGLFGAVMA